MKTFKICVVNTTEYQVTVRAKNLEQARLRARQACPLQSAYSEVNGIDEVDPRYFGQDVSDVTAANGEQLET